MVSDTKIVAKTKLKPNICNPDMLPPYMAEEGRSRNPGLTAPTAFEAVTASPAVSSSILFMSGGEDKIRTCKTISSCNLSRIVPYQLDYLSIIRCMFNTVFATPECVDTGRFMQFGGDGRI